MFGAIAGGIASALAGGAMSKLFGGGQKAASGGIQGDVLATDNNTVGMGDAGIKSAIQGRRLKANQTGKKFRVGIKSNISTNRNNLISGVDRCIHLNAMKKTTITSINRQTIKI